MGYIKYLLLYVFAFIFCCMYAQTESKTAKDSVFMICVQCDSLYNRICLDNPIIFGGPEHLAQFPGGAKELMIFLRNHIEYPLECKEQAIQGRVVVKFIIDESGKIICPYVRKSLHPALDKEALRVVKLMPNWKPTSNNKAPCKTCYTLPILFKL
ncbi:MAG: energy transducer TonB [Candidatus Azobacteroides sp.]|nr:energy transducer TonB [Candidatus Azobacteroides sp.]